MSNSESPHDDAASSRSGDFASPLAAEKEAWKLFESDGFTQARDAFQAILEKFPTSVGSLQGYVACLRKLRHFHQAAAALEAALVVHPEHVGLLAERVWLHIEQKNYIEAISCLDTAIQTGAAEPGIHLWKISLLRRERRFTDAEQALAFAARSFGRTPALDNELAWLLFHQRSYQDALSAFEALLETDSSDAIAWQGKIACLRRLEKIEEAEAAASNALRECPHSPGVLAERGWLAFDLGVFENAQAEFAAAQRLAPKDAQLDVCIALALTRQDTESAREAAVLHCRSALAIDPDMAEAHGCLGVIAFRRGRLGEAERHLKRSVALDARCGYLMDLGALHRQMGRPDEAEECFRQAIANDPEDSGAHVQLGSILLETRKNELALNEFRRAYALAPASAESNLGLALCLAELSRLDEAELTLRGALARLDASKCVGLHLALCQLLTRIGESGDDARMYEDALEHAGSAGLLKPNDANTHFYKGVVKFKLNDLQGALKCFEQALMCDQQHLQADINRQRVARLLRQERALTRSSARASVFLSIVFFMNILALWWSFATKRITNEPAFAALMSLSLGLLVVAAVLPWLSRLKMTGLEAELNIPKPKDALASVPRGDVGFGMSRPRSM